MKKHLTRILISIIIFFSLSIIFKINPTIKDIVIDNIYNNTFKFNKFKKIYNKYLGNIIPSEVNIDILVSSESLDYDIYKDGYKYNVSNNYPVSIIESGVVVYIGNIDGYGNSIIVQGNNEVDYVYGSIENINYKLYDYVEKENIIGNSISNYYYILYKKNGKYVNIDEVYKD